MSPNGGIPPGNPDAIWVHCRVCGHTSVMRGAWNTGCPRRSCSGGPTDIRVVSAPGDR